MQESTSAPPITDEDLKEFLLLVRRALLMIIGSAEITRRALLMIVRWIETRYGLSPN